MPEEVVCYIEQKNEKHFREAEAVVVFFISIITILFCDGMRIRAANYLYLLAIEIGYNEIVNFNVTHTHENAYSFQCMSSFKRHI